MMQPFSTTTCTVPEVPIPAYSKKEAGRIHFFPAFFNVVWRADPSKEGLVEVLLVVDFNAFKVHSVVLVETYHLVQKVL
jgi:hypothetical protein